VVAMKNANKIDMKTIVKLKSKPTLDKIMLGVKHLA